MRTALGSRMIPAGFCLLFVLALPLTAGPITNFYSIDYPGAIRTDAYKVNDYNQVVGAYQDAGGAYHGYIFDYSLRTFTRLDFPGSNRTLAYGINDNGEVTGYYRDSGNVTHGFLYFGGVWSSIDYSDSTRTFIYGDASDALVGRYRASNMVFHPFICTRTSGCSELPDYPGASSTVPYAINDSGTSVGYWADSTGSVYTGYSYDGSTFALLAYPGALATFAEGINNSGDVVGAWSETDIDFHGFLYRGGIFHPFDIAGAATTDNYAINNKGVLAGVWTDQAGQEHGYIATPEPASLTLFSFGLLGLAGLTLGRRKFR